MVAGVGLEPHDLRVMSPTSYQLLHPAMYRYSLQRRVALFDGANIGQIFRNSKPFRQINFVAMGLELRNG